jgi:hypothetical protein
MNIVSELVWYQELVTLTNKTAFEFNGRRRSTCILTTYALVDVLQKLGVEARPLRVEATVFPDGGRRRS